MITAIVNRKDSDSVCDALTKGGFIFTKIATSGGFLKKGNVTLLIGTDIDRVNDAVDIIRDNSARRTENAPLFPSHECGTEQSSRGRRDDLRDRRRVFRKDVVCKR